MSNETKFTPGPWLADTRSGCLAVYPLDREMDSPGIGPHDERNIHYSSKGAEYDGDRWHMDEQSQANAHLIAAAPELYEALDNILELASWEPYMDDAIIKARAALAKARGES